METRILGGGSVSDVAYKGSLGMYLVDEVLPEAIG